MGGKGEENTLGKNGQQASKRCSTSLVTRRLQNKVSGSPLNPGPMAKITKPAKPSADRMWSNHKSYTLPVGVEDRKPALKTSGRFSPSQTCLPAPSVAPLLGMYSRYLRARAHVNTSTQHARAGPIHKQPKLAIVAKRPSTGKWKTSFGSP